MAKEGVEIVNLKSFIRQMGKVTRGYRPEVYKAMRESLDNIKNRAADKYIIPRQDGLRTFSPWRMAKIQPAHPTKLTSRTKRLYFMLKDPMRWDNLTGRQTIQKGNNGSLVGTIRIAKGKNTKYEAYRGDLSVDIQNSHKFVGKRRSTIKDTTGEGKYESVETKQSLAIRFRHDTGIRGAKRPFVTPSAEEEDFKFKGILSRRLNAIGAL